MTATHLIDHLHLGQVQILRAATHFLQAQGVLKKCSAGDVYRREPDSHIGTLGFILVGALGILLALPVFQFLILYRVVISK